MKGGDSMLGIIWTIVNPNEPHEIGGYRWTLETDNMHIVGKSTYPHPDDCRDSISAR